MSLPRARELGVASCSVCLQVARVHDHQPVCCPRCGSRIHVRYPHSLSRTWALLVASMILYVPANLYPVMTNTYLGADSSSTILGGVALFLNEGDWLLAGIIFTASILVPLAKMMSLLYLLINVRRTFPSYRAHQHARLYRITELVGRWSMVDVFVIGILTALVQMGAISSVEPGIGALAFAAVVVLTMLAAISFDPRLIWDRDMP
ncbi:paraquat-inducible protein A [Thiolapillus sp.]